MNGKDLYRAIGQIEDGLILDANVESAGARRRSPALWALAAAACLCLACLGAFRQFWGTALVWNESSEASGVSTSKIRIPEGSVPVEMTRAEAETYYRLGKFPDVLGQDLRPAEQNTFYIYTGADGEPVYDGTELWYSGLEGSAGVALARVSAQAMPREGLSRLKGASVYLTASKEFPDYPVYTAQWERNGTTVCVTGNGMDRTEFIALVEELLPLGGKD